MGFAGNLRTLSMAEVVQTLTRIKATGVLRLAVPDGSGRDVVFKDGVIIGVSMKQGAEKQALLQRLVMEGTLDAEAAASISTGGSESAVVQALIENQLVTPEQVATAFQIQTEEELYDIFTWEAADFIFQDASLEEPEVTELVDHFERRQLQLSSNSLLMEAARRTDEWGRIKELIKDMSQVPGPVDGKEAELETAAATFPHSAVIPLVDAVRTVDDIVRDSVASRIDVCQTLYDLVANGLLCWLTRDDLIAHGDYLIGQDDWQRAARVYRRALAEFPTDRATEGKLASCLEHLGDAGEAAASYGQLAVSMLNEGDAANALGFAGKAVQLRADDARLRQTLVHCLLKQGDTVQAIAELKEVVALLLAGNRLEDARAACLQILELSKNDEFARRELARIFSRVEKDQNSEDVVVCVQCNEVNHREAIACQNCKASLQLSCLSCGRVVGASDRMCIFCGADPHGHGAQRVPGGSPSTSRIIRRTRAGAGMAPELAASVQALAEAASASSAGRKAVAAAGDEQAPAPGGDPAASGVEQWRVQIEQALREARANEEAGNHMAALVKWREVAKLQPDNPQLLAHIKDLEALVHEQAIEADIEIGHRMRRSRHYWKAVSAYRRALRVMGSDDPRIGPVTEALQRTERDRMRISALYLAAGLALLVLGWFAVSPYVIRHQLVRRTGELREMATACSDPQRISVIDQNLAELVGEVDSRLPSAHRKLAREALGEVQAEWYVRKQGLARIEIGKVAEAIKRRDPAEAGRLYRAFKDSFPGEFEVVEARRLGEALKALEAETKVVENDRRIAPDRLKKAKEIEETGRLADALAQYRELAGSAHEQVRIEAQAATQRLGPGEKDFQRRWDTALLVAQGDLVKGFEVLGQLMTDARSWGREGELLKLRAEAKSRLEAGERAYAALPPQSDPAALEGFIKDHPGTPQAQQAKSRLDLLRQRLANRDRSLEQQRQLLAAKRYEDAWKAGRDLVEGYGKLLDPGQLTLPLLIESQPTGVQVSLAGKPVGRTPLLLTYHPGDQGELRLDSPGWQPLSRPLPDAASDWKLQAALLRTPLWQQSFGRAISCAIALPDGSMVVAAGDTLALVDAGYQVKWRRQVLKGDELVEAAKTRIAHLPQPLPEGRLAVGLPSKDAVVLDQQGMVVETVVTGAQVRGRPLAYANEMFGIQIRLAVAADGIFSHALGGKTSRIPINRPPAISGPLAIPHDLDRLLVLADRDCHLVAIEESTRKTLWDHDLQASDCGQLVPLDERSAVVVLDGSRLSCFRFTPSGPVPAWSHPLKSPAVGDPVVMDGMIHLAAGNQLHRINPDGTVANPGNLPSPASSAVAVGKDLAAVGCQDGSLVVFGRDGEKWRSPCGQPVTAVAVGSDRILAGLSTGTVIVFRP